jgi:hypothetical protein
VDFAQAWQCISPEQACGSCNNCVVADTVSNSPAAYGLAADQPAFQVSHGEETLTTLQLRTGDKADVLREMNGIPAGFGDNTPLQQLPANWQSPLVSKLELPASHPVATAAAAGGRFIAVSRTPAVGHGGGPHAPYPNALISSPLLLLMVQVRPAAFKTERLTTCGYRHPLDLYYRRWIDALSTRDRYLSVLAAVSRSIVILVSL